MGEEESMGSLGNINRCIRRKVTGKVTVDRNDVALSQGTPRMPATMKSREKTRRSL